jgi:FMN phosphatase YigB (HAD superfamily)
MIKTVFFDLDGTLLPMDQDEFVKAYFGLLVKKLAPHGYDPDKTVKGIWAGTKAMIQNDGSTFNENRFWQPFSAVAEKDGRKDIALFDEFYETDFQAVAKACGYSENAKRAVEIVKEKGLSVVLATNPIFPPIATQSRMRWAGVSPDDFCYYTTYDNSRYCKPNPKYYLEILEKTGFQAEECLMVGNDVDEDMVASKLGFKVFLLTDCLINRSGEDISSYPHGNFDELIEYLKNL